MKCNSMAERRLLKRLSCDFGFLFYVLFFFKVLILKQLFLSGFLGYNEEGYLMFVENVLFVRPSAGTGELKDGYGP